MILLLQACPKIYSRVERFYFSIISLNETEQKKKKIDAVSHWTKLFFFNAYFPEY